MYKTWTHFALLACIYLLSTPLTAQIFVNASATGANDGSSWSDAYTDLQSALGQASPGDEIWVAAGVYNPGGALSATFQPTVSIINSTFFENRSGESGGAVYTQEDSTLLAIIGTSFRENQADNSGGALFLRTGTIASIDSSIFETNVSALGTDNGSGGAILFFR